MCEGQAEHATDCQAQEGGFPKKESHLQLALQRLILLLGNSQLLFPLANLSVLGSLLVLHNASCPWSQKPAPVGEKAGVASQAYAAKKEQTYQCNSATDPSGQGR